jgi:hypothetical protein
MKQLGISESDLMTGAYMDLIERKETAVWKIGISVAVMLFFNKI